MTSARLSGAYASASVVPSTRPLCSLHPRVTFEYPRLYCVLFSVMTRSENNEFYPARFLASKTHAEETIGRPNLLILNQPIAHFDAFSRLWDHSSYRICADGGANRLFDMFHGDLAGYKERYVKYSHDCNSLCASLTCCSYRM